MIEDTEAQSFRWVDGQVIQLAVYAAIATNTSPSSARPPYWARLDDTDAGRVELLRRIAVLQRHSDNSLHGTERWHEIVKWIEQEAKRHAL
jgi:hypothetical protein